MVSACPYDEEVKKQARILNKKNSAVASQGVLKDNCMNLREYLDGGIDEEALLALLEKVPADVSNQDEFITLCSSIGVALMGKADFAGLINTDLSVQAKILSKLAKVHSASASHATVVYSNLFTTARQQVALIHKMDKLGGTAKEICDNDSKVVKKVLDAPCVDLSGRLH